MRQAYQDEDEASYQNKVDIGNKYRKGTTMRPNWQFILFIHLFDLLIHLFDFFIHFIYFICYFIIWYFD